MQEQAQKSFIQRFTLFRDTRPMPKYIYQETQNTTIQHMYTDSYINKCQDYRLRTVSAPRVYLGFKTGYWDPSLTLALTFINTLKANNIHLLRVNIYIYFIYQAIFL